MASGHEADASQSAGTFRTVLLLVAIAATIGLAFAFIPVVLCIPVAVLALVARALLPRSGVPAFSARRLAATIGLTVVAIVVSLAIIEVGVRLTARPARPELLLYEFDPVNVYDLRPGARAAIVTNTEPGVRRFVDVQISEQRVRGPVVGPKATGEFRVVLAGDSFMFGFGVQREDTVAAQLQELLRELNPDRPVTVINLGVAGTTVTQHLGYLRERGFDFQPDLVIEAVFPGNDVMELMADDGVQPIAYPAELEGRYIHRQVFGSRRERAERWLAQHSRAYLAFRQIVRKRAILSFLAEGTRILPRIPIPAWDTSAPRFATWEVNLAVWYPELAAGFEHLVATLLRMKADCEARGIDFAVFSIPMAEEVVSDLYDERVSPFVDADTYEPYKATRSLEAAMRMHGVLFIPVHEALRIHPEPDALYFALDGHTTAQGNQVIAETLRDFIATRYYEAHDAHEE